MKGARTRRIRSFIPISGLCVFSVVCSAGLINRVHHGDGDSSLLDGYPLNTSGVTSYSTYLKHYYDNLTQNFGMNYMGSCGYVAMGMMLSYYDSAFCGTLIPTSYDIASIGSGSNLIDRANSPGILHDDIENTGYDDVYAEEDFDGAGYLSYVNGIKDFSFHAKLISLGSDLGYYNVNADYPASTTVSQRADILSAYFDDYLGLSSGSYSISYYDAGDYYNGQQQALSGAIISAIGSGKPVLVGIYNPNTDSRHAVIAYDYDQNGTIYYHSGLSHSGFSTHMTISQIGYTFLRSYMYLSFNLPGALPGANHIVGRGSYSNSYSYSQLNWFSTHAHAYSSYSYLNNSYHKAICSCGDYEIESHEPDMMHLVNGHLVGQCLCCGGTINL